MFSNGGGEFLRCFLNSKHDIQSKNMNFFHHWKNAFGFFCVCGIFPGKIPNYTKKNGMTTTNEILGKSKFWKSDFYSNDGTKKKSGKRIFIWIYDSFCCCWNSFCSSFSFFRVSNLQSHIFCFVLFQRLLSYFICL